MTGKQPFEAIVAAHGATVLRVCRAVLGPVNADDAWSDTFLSAMKAYPDLLEGANVEAWLVTIAHRKAIDITRASARGPIPVAQTPDDSAVPAVGSPGHGLDGDLADAVAGLPAKQRQAVAYHYLAGLPYAEIAYGYPETGQRGENVVGQVRPLRVAVEDVSRLSEAIGHPPSTLARLRLY